MLAKNVLKRLLRDTRGVTAVEYGLIIALLVIAMITALQGLANSSIAMWGDVDQKYVDANNGTDS